MNRSQLVRAVSSAQGMARQAVEDVVGDLLDVIVAEVRANRRVSLAGFGTFSPVARAPRIGRNPRTGAAVPIPASKGVRFAAGSTFKQALNSKEGAPMAVSTAAAKKTAAKKAPARKTAAKKTVATRAAAKKAPARKATATKTVARKAVAKKTVAKKTVAKKTVAKKAPARKTVAKKTPARKAPARKAAARR